MSSKIKKKSKKNGKSRSEKIAARKSFRRSLMGRKQEATVLEILEQAQRKGQFLKVELHQPNSAEDRSGKDFTVVKIVGQEKVEKSFGITISERRNGYSKMVHPDVPQFWFPLATKPKTIIKTVESLF